MMFLLIYYLNEDVFDFKKLGYGGVSMDLNQK